MPVQKFKELRAKMSPERQANNNAEAERMLRDMPLDARADAASGFADDGCIGGLATNLPIGDQARSLLRTHK